MQYANKQPIFWIIPKIIVEILSNGNDASTFFFSIQMCNMCSTTILYNPFFFIIFLIYSPAHSRIKMKKILSYSKIFESPDFCIWAKLTAVQLPQIELFKDFSPICNQRRRETCNNTCRSIINRLGRRKGRKGFAPGAKD